MPLSSRERAELRSYAHHLPVTVHIGHQGLTDSLRQTLNDALRTRELVKVQVARTADIKARDIAEQLAKDVNAEVVQTIGRTATLFRDNPDNKKKAYRPFE